MNAKARTSTDTPIDWRRVQDTQTSAITASTVFAFGTADPYGATKFNLTR